MARSDRYDPDMTDEERERRKKRPRRQSPETRQEYREAGVRKDQRKGGKTR